MRLRKYIITLIVLVIRSKNLMVPSCRTFPRSKEWTTFSVRPVLYSHTQFNAVMCALHVARS